MRGGACGMDIKRPRHGGTASEPGQTGSIHLGLQSPLSGPACALGNASK